MSDETLPSREERANEVIADWLRAVERGETPDRREWLIRHPDLDAELRSYFADQEAVLPIAQPLRAASVPDASTGLVRYFGDYELHGEIARGGMGIVYKARQVSVNRPVAVKMILAGQLAVPADVQRFRSEAETAANLDHPHLVPIYDVGEWRADESSAPVHYFSMKLIEGGSLAQCLPRYQSDARAAARLVSTVSRAVHFAHQRGLLHRDLKPGNILIDTQGQPHVTDFGLAKRLEGDGGMTQTGAILGTPEYMAPEQATGRKDLTTAADVYSLGAILYTLLTGRPPFRGETVLETLQQVVSFEPVAPHSMNLLVVRDLETICLKCLEKEPGRRYGSAERLADDLERWLNGEPIHARPVGRFERIGKWARRRPAVAGLIATVVVLLVGGIAGIAWQYRTALEQTELAREYATDAEDALSRAREAEADARRRAEKEATARIEAGQEKERALEQLELSRRTLYSSQLWRVAGLWERDPPQAQRLLEDAAFCPLDLRDFAWGHLHRLSRRDRQTLRGESARQVHALAYSPDGTLLALGDRNAIVVYEVDTGRLLHRVARYKAGEDPVMLLAFTPDGKKLLGAARKGYGGIGIRFWDVQEGKESGTLADVPAGLSAVALSADGKRIAGGTGGGNGDGKESAILIWDLATGKLLRRFEKRTTSIHAIAYSPNAKILATGTTGTRVQLWGAEECNEVGSMTTSGPTGVIRSLRFNPDGTRLACLEQFGFADGHAVHLWELPSRKSLRVPVFESKTAIEFSPDGKLLAVSLWDGTVSLVDPSTGRLVSTLGRHWAQTRALAFRPDSRQLASSAWGWHRDDVGYGEVKLWDVDLQSPCRTLPCQRQRIYAPALLSDDGRSFVSTVWLANSPFETACIDPTTGQERWRVEADRGRMVLSPDGRRIASFIPESNLVWLRDGTTGKPLTHLALDTGKLDGHGRVLFSADSSLLLAGGACGLRIWSMADLREVFAMKESVQFLDCSPSGSQLLLAEPRTTGTRNLLILDRATAKRRNIAAIQGDVHAMFVRGGSHAVVFETAGEQVAGRLFDLNTGQDRTLMKEKGDLDMRRFHLSRDGRFLAIDLAGDVQVWDLQTGNKRTAFRAGGSSSLSFHPDGRSLAVGNFQRVVVWDCDTGQARLTFDNGSYPAVFMPDGKSLLMQSYFDHGTMLLAETAPESDRAVLGRRPSRFSAPIQTLSLADSGKTLLAARYVPTSDAAFDVPSRVVETLRWNLKTGREEPSLSQSGERVADAALSPDGSRLAVIPWVYDKAENRWMHGPIEFRGTSDGARQAVADLPKLQQGLHSLVKFSADGRILAVRSPDKLFLVDADRGTIRREIAPARGIILHLEPGPDGFLWWVRKDGLEFYDMAAGVVKGRIKGPNIVAGSGVSANGNVLAVAGRNEVTLWDVRCRTLIRAIPVSGSCVALNADGTCLAVGGAGTSAIWDVATGKELRRMRSDSEGISALLFAPDGKTLIAGENEGLVRLWDVGPIR